MGTEAGSPAQLPAKIGRYTVLGYLADGGMAEIFLGRDATGPVVIKRILPHLARQGGFVAMFLDEARIGSLVRHPNVAETRELGQVGNDLFLVLEYLAGESVLGLLRRGAVRKQPLPFALGAHIIAEACAGLHAAHELRDEDGNPYGLVHRDVSPSNLFVTYDGDVKLLDFGVATAAHRLTKTATGQVKGKFSYMAPEQCLGEQLDRRTDIFALGVVLYELTTQRRLFKRQNELLVLKAVTQEPVPRPTRSMPGYPEVLERIVMKALSREPDRRHVTALELRNELLAAMTALGFRENPREALARHMQELFPERLAEKRALVRHVRAGTDFGVMPAAEVDENVELPQATGSIVPLPRKSAVPVLLVLLVLAGLGAGGYWYWKQQKTESVAAPIAHDAAVVAEVVADAAAVAPPPIDAALVIRIDTIPTGATVYIDGEQRGTTPYELVLGAPAKLVLRVELANYTDVTQELSLDRTQTLLIPLSEATKKKPAKPPKKKEPDPFKRFD